MECARLVAERGLATVQGQGQEREKPAEAELPVVAFQHLDRYAHLDDCQQEQQQTGQSVRLFAPLRVSGRTCPTFPPFSLLQSLALIP